MSEDMFTERLKQTQRIDTLDPRNNPAVAEAISHASVVICDIDYTLLDVSAGHDLGINRLAEATSQTTAQRVNDLFHLIVEGHRIPESVEWDKREEFNQAIARMEEIQKDIVSQWGLKVWSVETWIKMAEEDQGRIASPQEIIAGRDAYWSGRRDESQVYEDIEAFAQYLSVHNKPLYLMTGSYSILQVSQDGRLSYDPSFAENYKRESLEGLPFKYQHMFIGDPIDKPSLGFFNRVFSFIETMEKKTDEDYLSTYLVVGDSERNDLEVPKQMGMNTLLIKRN